MLNRTLKIISIITMLMVVCVMGLFFWNKSYPNDQVATNDFFMHDSDLEPTENKAERNQISFLGKVSLFVSGDCGICPIGAKCKVCEGVLKVETADGEEISILPGPAGNFKDFQFLQVGNNYEFIVDIKIFDADLVHYILIDAK